MNLLIADDYEALSRLAANLLFATIVSNPDAQLGLVGGETPVRAYALLVESLRASAVPVSGVHVLAVNEWCGLQRNDPATCEAYLRRHVLDPLAIPPARFHGFRSDADDWDAECNAMRKHLKERPLELCVLGLGANGHLAANEPGDMLAPSSHLAELAETTQHHAMLEGAENPPEHSLTLGIGDLMHARQVVLLVSGKRKAEQLRRLMAHDIATSFPASMLWLHQNAVCLCDREAYSLYAQDRETSGAHGARKQ